LRFDKKYLHVSRAKDIAQKLGAKEDAVDLHASSKELAHQHDQGGLDKGLELIVRQIHHIVLDNADKMVDEAANHGDAK